jgi:hypothetical protein
MPRASAAILITRSASYTESTATNDRSGSCVCGFDDDVCDGYSNDADEIGARDNGDSVSSPKADALEVLVKKMCVLDVTSDGDSCDGGRCQTPGCRTAWRLEETQQSAAERKANGSHVSCDKVASDDDISDVLTAMEHDNRRGSVAMYSI